MSNKALIIGVSLFVTMAIASAVLFTINRVTGIYKQVYETDVSIQSSFSEFDAFDGTTKTKLDMLNAAKKYKDNSSVYVVTGVAMDDFTGSNLDKKDKANANKVNITSLESSLVNDDNTIKNTNEASRLFNTYVITLDDDTAIIGFN